jgi:hypothetical protein
MATAVRPRIMAAKAPRTRALLPMVYLLSIAG